MANEVIIKDSTGTLLFTMNFQNSAKFTFDPALEEIEEIDEVESALERILWTPLGIRFSGFMVYSSTGAAASGLGTLKEQYDNFKTLMATDDLLELTIDIGNSDTIVENGHIKSPSVDIMGGQGDNTWPVSFTFVRGKEFFMI